MEKILPHYGRELTHLRHGISEFAYCFPDAAGMLKISGGESSDPGVQRVMHGTALLCAHLARKLEYGYVRLTNDLLGIQSPFYLRPIPSCSVVQIGAMAGSSVTSIPRGTELRSKGTSSCGFRTVYDVVQAPILVTARFMPRVDVPATPDIPTGVGCGIAITIETTDPAIAFGAATNSPMRVYIDADGPARAALYDAIFMRSLCTCVESEQQWHKLPAPPFSPVGALKNEALLPTPWRQEGSLRLLTEYFAFPDKFDFFDIDLKAVLAHCPAGTRRLVLHLLLPDLHHTTADLLRALPATALQLGCTPVINMFSHATTPIRLRKSRNKYNLAVPHVGNAKAVVYSIDAMQLLQNATRGGAAIDLSWFLAKKLNTPYFWLFELADATYGTPDTVSFVDRVPKPVELDEGTVDVRVTCTNGDLPCSLRIGSPDGDLTSDQDIGGRPIRMLSKPTAPLLLADQPDAHWELVAFAHANHQSMTQMHLPTLLSLLRMHARPDCVVTAQQLSGIVDVSRCRIQEWVEFLDHCTLQYGYEVSLTIDEAAFKGRSISVFAQLMERFFAYYLTAPNFLRLHVLGKDGQVLIRGTQQLGPQSPA
ncbi:type VI secretion system baseplate subunit TssF [Massilia dura]|uniref:Type VI secretion system baseplate subunit TssF n=1 Tax=Pseudoduganella dura TaxID=321982 RepID=A0A6I3X9F4_9BURK|nr:type VI secretion system baseplate subunit TssF [Pseudoduganella dura]MUI12346.1 type VI secretion system baseplate subunit TssF [Pseudoduganella dura]GGX99639.1 hypothetical protein GCM10007386_33080 [Pseudoduganella dura]